MNEIDPTQKATRRSAVKTLPDRNIGKRTEDTPSASSKDRVTLSQSNKVEAANTGGGAEIRQDLVAKFKATLQDGNYVVKAQEIAEKMVQKIRENKNRAIL